MVQIVLYKHNLGGLPLPGNTLRFLGDAAVGRWLTEKWWSQGAVCPKCGPMSVQHSTEWRAMLCLCRNRRCGKLSYRIRVTAGCLRLTNRTSARHVEDAGGKALQESIRSKRGEAVQRVSDGCMGHHGLERLCHAVKHSTRRLVTTATRTNSAGSFWLLLKRGYSGTGHEMLSKHTRRPVNEVVGRRSMRERCVSGQMAQAVQGMDSKFLCNGGGTS